MAATGWAAALDFGSENFWPKWSHLCRTLAGSPFPLTIAAIGSNHDPGKSKFAGGTHRIRSWVVSERTGK
jgi:hypothetical protein